MGVNSETLSIAIRAEADRAIASMRTIDQLLQQIQGSAENAGGAITAFDRFQSSFDNFRQKTAEAAAQQEEFNKRLQQTPDDQDLRAYGEAMGFIKTETQNATQELSDFEKSAVSIGQVVAAGAVVAAGQQAVGAFAEAEVAGAKLQAVLRATGGAVGYTAGQLKVMANEMQRRTIFDDDSVTNAQAVLATFRNIQGVNFQDALASAADMASVMGTDLQSAVVQVGKAMNDPEQGISALSRVGVSFTDAQKDMIASLQAAGDVAGAQQIVVAELKAEFGGAAATIGTTFAGSLAKTQNAIGDMSESFGKSLAPSVELGAGALKAVADVIGGLPEPVLAFSAAAGGIILIAPAIVSNMGAITAAMKALQTTMLGPAGLIALAVGVGVALASASSEASKSAERAAESSRTRLSELAELRRTTPIAPGFTVDNSPLTQSRLGIQSLLGSIQNVESRMRGVFNNLTDYSEGLAEDFRINATNSMNMSAQVFDQLKQKIFADAQPGRFEDMIRVDDIKVYAAELGVLRESLTQARTEQSKLMTENASQSASTNREEIERLRAVAAEAAGRYQSEMQGLIDLQAEYKALQTTIGRTSGLGSANQAYKDVGTAIEGVSNEIIRLTAEQDRASMTEYARQLADLNSEITRLGVEKTRAGEAGADFYDRQLQSLNDQLATLKGTASQFDAQLQQFRQNRVAAEELRTAFEAAMTAASNPEARAELEAFGRSLKFLEDQADLYAQTLDQVIKKKERETAVDDALLKAQQELIQAQVAGSRDRIEQITAVIEDLERQQGKTRDIGAETENLREKIVNAAGSWGVFGGALANILSQTEGVRASIEKAVEFPESEEGKFWNGLLEGLEAYAGAFQATFSALGNLANEFFTLIQNQQLQALESEIKTLEESLESRRSNYDEQMSLREEAGQSTVDYEIQQKKLLAEEEEKLESKRQELEKVKFEQQKKRTLGEIAMATAQGMAMAFVASRGDPITGGIFAGIIAAAGAAQAAIVLGQQYPQLYDGGIISGSPGGSAFIAGERGQDELILPLRKQKLQELGLVGGGNTFNFYLSGSDPRQTALAVVDEIEKLKREGYLN